MDTSNFPVGHFYCSQLRNGGLYYYLQALVADIGVSSHRQYCSVWIGYASGIEPARWPIVGKRF